MSPVDALLVVLALVTACTTAYLAIQTYRSQHVAASPQIEAHDPSAQGEGADSGAAATQVHGLPAPGHARAQVADRTPNPGIAGRADDDSELWAEPHVLPMVQASVQPASRGQARRSHDQPAPTADRASDQGTSPMVTPYASHETIIEWELQQPRARRRARDLERAYARSRRRLFERTF